MIDRIYQDLQCRVTRLRRMTACEGECFLILAVDILEMMQLGHPLGSIRNAWGEIRIRGHIFASRMQAIKFATRCTAHSEAGKAPGLSNVCRDHSGSSDSDHSRPSTPPSPRAPSSFGPAMGDRNRPCGNNRGDRGDRGSGNHGGSYDNFRGGPGGGGGYRPAANYQNSSHGVGAAAAVARVAAAALEASVASFKTAMTRMRRYTSASSMRNTSETSADDHPAHLHEKTERQKQMPQP